MVKILTSLRNYAMSPDETPFNGRSHVRSVPPDWCGLAHEGLDVDASMSTPTPAPSTFYSRRFTRSGNLVAGLATVVALWLGLSAPGVSPVTPMTKVDATVVTTNHGATKQGAADSTVNFVHHDRGHR